MGTVFMDTDNKKDFSDRLTWLFGHARGSKVADNRMFNDVNLQIIRNFSISTSMLLLKHLSVSSTMKQWAWLLKLQETAFYRTSFDEIDFTDQLNSIYEASRTKTRTSR